MFILVARKPKKPTTVAMIVKAMIMVNQSIMIKLGAVQAFVCLFEQISFVRWFTYTHSHSHTTHVDERI